MEVDSGDNDGVSCHIAVGIPDMIDSSQWEFSLLTDHNPQASVKDDVLFVEIKIKPGALLSLDTFRINCRPHPEGNVVSLFIRQADLHKHSEQLRCSGNIHVLDYPTHQVGISPSGVDEDDGETLWDVTRVWFCLENNSLKVKHPHSLWQLRVNTGDYLRSLGERFEPLAACPMVPALADMLAISGDDRPQRDPWWYKNRLNGGSWAYKRFGCYAQYKDDPMDVASSIRMRKGRLWEDGVLIAYALSAKTTSKVRERGRCVNPEMPGYHYSPDALIVEKGMMMNAVPQGIKDTWKRANMTPSGRQLKLGVLEIKVSGFNSEMRPAYVYQVYHGMMILNCYWARVVKYDMSRSAIKMYHIWRNADLEQRIKRCYEHGKSNYENFFIRDRVRSMVNEFNAGRGKTLVMREGFAVDKVMFELRAWKEAQRAKFCRPTKRDKLKRIQHNGDSILKHYVGGGAGDEVNVNIVSAKRIRAMIREQIQLYRQLLTEEERQDDDAALKFIDIS